ncbi:unnamed protein product, partial [Ectocarpus fasciculatus]
SVEDGYRVQDELIRQCNVETLGKQIGWKVGATSDAAVKAIGFGPFYGPLFESSLVGGGSICLSAMGNFRAVEAEIGFTVNADFPSLGGDKEYQPDDVWANIESICPSVELAAGRVQGSVAVPTIIADCANNGYVVRGSKTYSTSDIKNGLSGVADISVVLEINGKVVGEASASAVLQNPVLSLTWLVNELNRSNKMLRKGDFVMTGAMIVHAQLSPGDRVVSKFRV